MVSNKAVYVWLTSTFRVGQTESEFLSPTPTPGRPPSTLGTRLASLGLASTPWCGWLLSGPLVNPPGNHALVFPGTPGARPGSQRRLLQPPALSAIFQRAQIERIKSNPLQSANRHAYVNTLFDKTKSRGGLAINAIPKANSIILVSTDGASLSQFVCITQKKNLVLGRLDNKNW